MHYFLLLRAAGAIPEEPLENIGSLTDLGRAIGVSIIFNKGITTKK